MKRIVFWACLGGMLCIPLHPGWANPAVSVARKAATELIEFVSRQSGKAMAKELSEFGGDEAVHRVLVKVMQKGGESAVHMATKIVRTHGVSALKALEHAPEAVRYLPSLSDDMAAKAISAINHQPDLLRQLVVQHGEKALHVVAKHPGVGADVANSLGREGLETALSLSTPQVIRLRRLSPDILRVPTEQRVKILEMLKKFPEKILDLLEKHPRILYTSAGVAVLINYRDGLLGGSQMVLDADGNSREVTNEGTIVRIISNVLQIVLQMPSIQSGLMMIFIAISLVILGKGILAIRIRNRLAKLDEKVRNVKEAA